LLSASLSLTFSTTKQWSVSQSAPRERSHIEYTGMPSPIHQYVIDLIVSLPIRRGPDVFMNVSVRKHSAQEDNVTSEISERIREVQHKEEDFIWSFIRNVFTDMA
jgi:hypothetical protein